jgi:hypothetical protein
MFAFVSLAAVAAPVSSSKSLVGESRECIGNKWHNLKYNATYGADSSSFVDLDSESDIHSVSCDLDHTKLSIRYHNEVEAAEWLVKFHDWNDHFLVGGTKWNCGVNTTGRVGLILRRVVGASMDGAYINVRASIAKYDEVFEDADIAFNTEGSCDSADKEVCVGFNTDCSSPATPAAGKSLPIYSNSALDIACSSCFVAFDADVFVEVHIRGFEVVNASAGLRNVNLVGATVIDAKAQKSWSTGVDKTPDVLPKTTLVDFKVGVVPFLIWLEVPAEIKADLTFNTAAGQFSLVVPLGAAPGKKMMVTMPVPANFQSNQQLAISSLRINGNLPAPKHTPEQLALSKARLAAISLLYLLCPL